MSRHKTANDGLAGLPYTRPVTEDVAEMARDVVAKHSKDAFDYERLCSILGLE